MCEKQGREVLLFPGVLRLALPRAMLQRHRVHLLYLVGELLW